MVHEVASRSLKAAAPEVLRGYEPCVAPGVVQPGGPGPSGGLGVTCLPIMLTILYPSNTYYIFIYVIVCVPAHETARLELGIALEMVSS